MSAILSKKEAQQVLEKLMVLFPDAHCELEHRNPYELLIATILSAQCTDVRVNQTTKTLFPKYPTPQHLAKADPAELEQDIHEVGLFRTKAKNIRHTAQILVSEYGGVVPNDREKLMSLPGVGRKTANVVLSNAFGVPAIAVDTHVFRVSNRIGLSRSTTPEQCEQDLQALLPKDRWSLAHHLLIFQGRRMCKAKSPDCAACPLKEHCLFYRGAGSGKRGAAKDGGNRAK
ncbi:MAG: endonuclease III [Ndongobacter sp.]|nr:endonuclease III [Ndongobacter sp.]